MTAVVVDSCVCQVTDRAEADLEFHPFNKLEMTVCITVPCFVLRLVARLALSLGSFWRFATLLHAL